MAADAECGGGHRGCMAVTVAVEVKGMTTCAGGPSEDGCDLRAIERIFERRWRGMAVGAAVVVDAHRIIGQMTDRNTGRCIFENTQPRC